MILSIAMFVLGVVLVGAGFWWLWGGRWGWLPAHRMQASCSQPTRMVIGLVHLVLGYHVAVWSLPTDRTPIHMPKEYWPWVVAGATVMVAGSRWMDRFDQSAGDGGET
jgi:hypothetical protein